jgi:hypothetical protein
VLVGAALQVPQELRQFTASFRMPLPTPGELRALVYDVAADWGAENGRREVQTTNKVLDLLVRNLAGLTATDARRLARRAIVSAMYTAHAQGRTLNQEDLLAEIQQTRPLSVLMAEQVAAIREWAASRTVPCD